MHTDILKTTEGEKIKDVKSYRVFLKYTVSALTGFLFSCAKLPGGISPFACAFLASAEKELAPFIFFGSVLSYFIFSPFETSLKYLISLSLCLVLRLIVLKKLKIKDTGYSLSIICTASLLCGSSIYLSFTHYDIASVLLHICESLLSLLCVIIYRKAFSIPLHITGLRVLTSKAGFYIVFTLASFLLSASSFTLGNISPVRIICCIAILFVSQYKGVLFSSITGIYTALSFSLVPSYSCLFPFYTLSSAVSGLFSAFGQYSVSVSFAVTSLAVLVLQKEPASDYFPLIETVAAAVIYSAVPVSKISSLQSKLEKSTLTEDSQAEREVAKSLRRTAEKIEAVSEITESISNRFDKIINPEINKVFSSLQQDLCFGCGKKKECWSKYFNETAKDIMIISGIRPERNGKTNLEYRCIKPNALLRQINKHYPEFLSYVSTKMKLSEMRSALSDQFLCIADFLYELSDKWNVTLTENFRLSRNIFYVLKEKGIEALSVKYLADSFSPVRIEMEFYEDLDEINFTQIARILSATVSCNFGKPRIDLSPEKTTIIFTEKQNYKLLWGFSQIPFSETRICGDSVGFTEDESGNGFVILCDGMGTGARASIDATMTSELMENLLSCGFSFENTLKAVNSALIMKSTDESLSTVDSLCVNLYTGKAYFYKAGATLSFLRKENCIKVINETSMPIGIIRSVSLAKKEETLSEGDIVLLVSDGVTSTDCGWINDELSAWSTNNMEDLAKHIASLSKMRQEKNNEDDITVVAVKVTKSDL